MSEGRYSRKIKEAVHILFFKHHRLPGVRGWELKQELGSDWKNIIDVLNGMLRPFDLKVTTVFDDPEIYDDPTQAQLLDARYYITLRGTIDQKIAKTIGWRVDDIAGLAVATAYIISQQRKSPRNEIEKILQEKLPGWRVKISLDKYIHEGYLGEDNQGYLYLDWRTRAEIDQKKLVDYILAYKERQLS